MDENLDLVEMVDDEGNTLLMRVVEYFFYNGDEYVVLAEYDPEAADNTAEVDQVDCYVLRVNTFTDERGEECEEFLPIEDEALEAKLMAVASTRVNEEEEEEEE